MMDRIRLPINIYIPSASGMLSFAIVKHPYYISQGEYPQRRFKAHEQENERTTKEHQM